MPNISFDIFFQDDIINITASRSGGSAPKVKPAWKVRTAPKLPPKEPFEPKTERAFGPPKLKQAPQPSTAKPKPKEIKEAPKVEEAAKQPAAPKKIPKLGPAANGKAPAKGEYSY
jgi:hypothetical protein